jgi:predicted DNA-binding protein with PD1-like motif
VVLFGHGDDYWEINRVKNAKPCLFIAGGLISMAGLSAQAAENDSAIYVTSTRAENGKAPGMQVQLLSENDGRKEYAVIFAKGDEAFSGLTEFAGKYHVSSAHFTAIGALRGATLAWFSPERKAYKEIPVEGQLEVASMIGDIALFNGKPVVHTHMVVALPDGTTRAGHVLAAHVWPTLEVMVTVEPIAMNKSFDQETGLSLIDPALAASERK